MILVLVWMVRSKALGCHAIVDDEQDSELLHDLLRSHRVEKGNYKNRHNNRHHIHLAR